MYLDYPSYESVKIDFLVFQHQLHVIIHVVRFTGKLSAGQLGMANGRIWSGMLIVSQY